MRGTLKSIQGKVNSLKLKLSLFFVYIRSNSKRFNHKLYFMSNFLVCFHGQSPRKDGSLMVRDVFFHDANVLNNLFRVLINSTVYFILVSPLIVLQHFLNVLFDRHSVIIFDDKKTIIVNGNDKM